MISFRVRLFPASREKTQLLKSTKKVRHVGLAYQEFKGRPEMLARSACLPTAEMLSQVRQLPITCFCIPLNFVGRLKAKPGEVLAGELIKAKPPSSRLLMVRSTCGIFSYEKNAAGKRF